MQTAAKRLTGESRARRRQGPACKPHLATADDTALLDVLPIAAAIVGQTETGCPKILSFNDRFLQTVDRSTCTALNWNEADCLKTGPIAELLIGYFKDPLKPGELDFRDGEGVSCGLFPDKARASPEEGR